MSSRHIAIVASLASIIMLVAFSLPSDAVEPTAHSTQVSHQGRWSPVDFLIAATKKSDGSGDGKFLLSRTECSYEALVGYPGSNASIRADLSNETHLVVEVLPASAQSSVAWYTIPISQFVVRHELVWGKRDPLPTRWHQGPDAPETK